MEAEAVKRRVRELYRSGMQRKAIARETGLSERTIGRICADLSPPIEHRGHRRKKVIRAYVRPIEWDEL